MSKLLLNTEVIDEVKGTAIIGHINRVANPSFQGNTNFWSNSALALNITSSGVSAVGSGNLYQILNTDDVVSGTANMARVYCNTVSGTWKLLVGSTIDASAIGAVTLTTGWNSVRFTAGAANYLQLKSTSEASTDTLIASPVEVREQVDLEIAGQIRNLGVEFSEAVIDGNIHVGGNITASGTGGTLVIASTATISGATQITGHTSVVGSIYAAGATISALTGVVTTTSQLIVSGAAQITGKTSIVGSINVAGVTCTDNAVFLSNLAVSGPFVAPNFSAVAGQVVATSGLVAVGDFYAQKNVYVTSAFVACAALNVGTTGTFTGSINSAGATLGSQVSANMLKANVGAVGGATSGAICFSTDGNFYGCSGGGWNALA